jgi:hypothetical protein
MRLQRTCTSHWVQASLTGRAHAVLHRFCQLLLAVCQQRFNLLVRVVTDGVDLFGEGLA